MAGSTKLYGVIDCARAPEAFEHLARLEPDAADCLFAGRLDPQVRRASPFVVELAPSDPLSKLWRSSGWGKAWGLLFSSTASLPVVRRRLKHFTMVRLPDGSGPVLFRFWDPRVFRTFLPTVEPSDLSPWFEDIDRYIVETPDGAGSLRYALDGGALSVEQGPPPTR
jgi:hypothetical protein